MSSSTAFLGVENVCDSACLSSVTILRFDLRYGAVVQELRSAAKCSVLYYAPVLGLVFSCVFLCASSCGGFVCWMCFDWMGN
jgi:hypothetical protein